AARNRMRRLVVDRFCISATRVTRLSAGLRRSAGANHQFLGWRFPLLFYGAATEFLARVGPIQHSGPWPPISRNAYTTEALQVPIRPSIYHLRGWLLDGPHAN